MEFAILGPLEVSAGDTAVAVPGTRQRALLAVLVLHVGEVVSVDRLVDVIWEDEPPAHPRNALQSQVSQLRRRLADGHDVVAAQPPGYVLRVDPATVDAVRFETLVREGRTALREGDEGGARRRLAAALALWRGAPLPEFAGRAFADLAASRLEELRLGALEDRIECDLRAGRHQEVVAELERLVADHPLRERLCGQLMLALARSGRQADALEVFHAARRVLDEELGIDPGRALVQVYETLLRQEDEGPQTVPTTAVAPPPSASVSGDLPRPLSSFVGREDAVDRVVELVGRSRLVTLTGPGGVGKTRLALEAAWRCLDTDPAPDGAWLVELAGLDDPRLVAPAVADTLGLVDAGGIGGGAAGPDATERVTAALRSRRCLLILDNCEHLVDEVASFARHLGSRATDVTLLATSREALGLPGETVWSVPSLDVPSPDSPVTPDTLREWGAAALFLDRIEAADPDLVLDAETAALIAEGCRRLDGIPLALELAAARVRTLGLADLVRRLDDRFAVLTTGDRTALPRQQTLHNVIGWSWDLLDPAEQVLFRRLSVFAAPASADDIEAVCGGQDLPRDGVTTLVAALVDKSMLVADRRVRPTRFRMLESLRAFATARLEDSGEAAAVRERHTDHVLVVAADLVARLRGRDQLEAMQSLDARLDDVRAALGWLASTDDGERGGRLATGLGWYWYLRGHREEGLRWLGTFARTAAPRDAALATLWSALTAPTALPLTDLIAGMDEAVAGLDQHGTDHDRTFANLVAAAVLMSVGDHVAAATRLAEARRLVEATGDELQTATTDLLDGNARLSVGDVPGARRRLEAALGRFTGLGDRWGQVQCLTSLLTCDEATGDLPLALRHADRGIDLATELRLGELETVLLARRASVAVLAGDEESARLALGRARRRADELGVAMVTGNVDLAAGFLALRTGRLDEAIRSFAGVLEWLGDAPLPGVRSYALVQLGTATELLGDPEHAATLHRDGYAAACQAGDPRGIALALEGLAAAYAASDRAADAAVLLGAAHARRASVGLPLPDAERTDVDRAEAAARGRLGDEAFGAAEERGRSLPEHELPVR